MFGPIKVSPALSRPSVTSVKKGVYDFLAGGSPADSRAFDGVADELDTPVADLEVVGCDDSAALVTSSAPEPLVCTKMQNCCGVSGTSASFRNTYP